MLISEALSVGSGKLWKQGVFDSYLGIDSRLHLDPALLRTTKVPEFRGSAARFEKYFADTLVLLSKAIPDGALASQAIRRLIFPEIPEASLGYAVGSNAGRGINIGLTRQLYATARELVSIGIDDPAIFEIAVVFEEGFGADLISDMTLSVISEDIGKYNERVCEKLGIPTKPITVRGREINAAFSTTTERPIVLLPHSLLSILPEATSFDEIGDVIEYNEKLRQRLNQILGANWAREFARMHKRARKRLLLQNPDLLRGMIASYRKRTPIPYDFNTDPLGEVIWKGIGEEFAEEFTLDLNRPETAADLQETVKAIIRQFKRLIEDNGLSRLLYSDDGKQRPEKFSQLLFYSLADTYCKANNLDVSAEPNAGRGPVDFKISHGYDARATVELKLSSNSGALNGLLAQLPTYAKAEQSTYSCFVLIVTGRTRTKVSEVIDTRNKLLEIGKPVPDLVVIDAYDAYQSPSASNLDFDPSIWD